MKVWWIYWQDGEKVSDWQPHAFKSNQTQALCGAQRPETGYKYAGTSGGECADCLKTLSELT